jgi:hypothetical protein
MKLWIRLLDNSIVMAIRCLYFVVSFFHILCFMITAYKLMKIYYMLPTRTDMIMLKDM